jgi:hypothetical protein
LKIENSIVIEVSFYLIAFVILILGIVNFFKQRKMITENENTLEIIKIIMNDESCCVVSCDKPLDQDYWDAQYKAKTTGWDLGLSPH